MNKCTIVLKIEVFKSRDKLLKDAKVWEKLNHYQYDSDNDLIADYVLTKKNYIHSESPQVFDSTKNLQKLSIKAKDCKCIKCKEKAVAFYPAIDPDIKSFPYCRKCLDEIQLKVMITLSESNKNKKA